ncbi:MAG: hypothetical protein ACQKBT_03795 [Puniceicoccales bacterium]
MATIPWMQKGPFGLMVHWLSNTQPRDGYAIADWDDKVDAFDLEKFWTQVRETGAKWLIFTLGQNTGLYCSPNSYLDREYPGLCSRRDLFREIAELGKRDGVRMIAYLPSEVDAHPAETRSFWRWDMHPRDKSEFQEKYMRFVRAYAESYGELLDGWFFDGAYNAVEKPHLRTQTWHNGRFDFARWLDACRAGNPNVVVSFCRGANDPGYVTPLQDFLSGECNDLKLLKCESAEVDGVQWHALPWIDCFWMHAKLPGTIDPPRYELDELYEFLHQAQEHGGAVTFNVGIYEDGTMAEPSIAQLVELKKRSRN